MDNIEKTPWPYVNDEKICIYKFEGNRPVVTHEHEFIELVIMGTGSCIHRYNGIEIPLVQGDIFTVLPHEKHSYDINRKTVIYNCLFYPEVIKQEWNNLKKAAGVYDFLMIEPALRVDTGKQQILHLNSMEYSYIENILNHMVEEQRLNLSGRELVLKADLILLLIFLGRAWDSQFSNQLKIFDEKRVFLKETMNYIEEHINEELDISKIASKNFTSPVHFRKLFKENTGLAPIEYINMIRVSKAVTYMKETNMNVAQISELVGINDQNYFARLFKKIMGCTPTQYLKKIHKC